LGYHQYKVTTSATISMANMGDGLARPDWLIKVLGKAVAGTGRMGVIEVGME
jgi:hypothetical protein